MSFRMCIKSLEKAKEELQNEVQFLDEEKEMLLLKIDSAIELIRNLWRS